MTGDELRFRAALSRFAVGLVALVLLPTFYPVSRRHLWIWLLYLLVAAIEQVLIRRRIGGGTRALLSGVLDIGVLTYTVHNLGSVVSPMSSLYLFAGVANALVVEARVAYALAIVGPLAFDALVTAECLGWLPYAADDPVVAALGAPAPGRALMSGLFVTIFVPACTSIVVTLVRVLRKREAELVAANQRLEELSLRDPLTGLFNRRHLFACVETELARVRRGHSVALLMFDLDGFKRVNDAQGHLRGDVLLKEIASAVAGTTRTTDVACRYGGDEFCVLLPDTSDEQARAAAERVARGVRDVGLRFDANRPVTASVGVALGESSDTVAALLRRADENAYKAKQSGGDRVVA